MLIPNGEAEDKEHIIDAEDIAKNGQRNWKRHIIK
jgi:hypothetical protein